MLWKTSLRVGLTFELALALLVVSPGVAAAGIVNVISAMSAEAPEGLSGSVSASANLASGNTDLLVVGLSPVIRYRAEDHLWIGIMRGEYGRSNDERILASSFEHVRYRKRLSEAWSGEVFAQHAYDEFRRLNVRTLFGLGPKVDLLEREGAKVSLGAAYMFEYEKLSGSGGTGDAGDSRIDHRLSAYLGGDLVVAKRIELVQTLYAQPRFDRPEDIRLLSESQVSIRATERISLTTSLTVAYDARPPDDVDGTDLKLTSGVTWSF